ncbi:MAG: hypothetical protein PSV23_08705 [Brevundimonas sp.]|uniref:DUF6880 family protein n=1 Tax=Brevundimonas sp. TaxID=1871086 RepID=UPI002489CD6C|nr:DUF6880 family protein [Brevundimonas sp.]MDI1326860.1 hypothetical protein [Brevundimonas sp.]
MASRPTTVRKTLSEANLAALGADRLAALLIEVADGALKRRLRMELAAEVGAPDLALELDKRLTTLAASGARVSWRKRPELLADLQMLRRMIVGRLGPMDAKLALDRLVVWFDLYPSLAARVKDPKGELTLVFDSASTDLAALASSAGPDVAGPVLAEALSTRLSEWASWVGRGAAALSPVLARRLLSDLTTARARPTGRLALVVRKLADRAGDIDAWILAIPDDDRRKPEVAAEIARRLAQAGRAGEARAALEVSRTEPPAASRWGRGKVAEAPALPDNWHSAEIAVLEAEGHVALAEEARWSLFERTLSEDTLRTLLAALPDFEDVIALDRAFAIAGAFVDPMKGLAFLMNWPAHREAAEMVLARRDEIRGSVDDAPLWAARLAGRYPDAALLLTRARARALVRFGDGMTEEVESLVGEAEVLFASAGVAELETHAVFVEGLKALAAPRRPVWR